MANNNLNNILSMPYVQWLEKALQELTTFPNIKGICLNAISDTGEIYTNYYEVSMTDKITIAGLIQQDAMLDTLTANGIIESADEEGEADGEEKE